MGTIEENWNYNIDFNEIEESLYSNFELEINSLFKSLLTALDDGLLRTDVNNQANLALTYDEELKTLIDGNKALRQKIDQTIKELTQKQSQYEAFKKDQKLLTQEVKETHEAFLMARKCYKKILKMYFSVESRKNETQVVFVQFFTEVKKDSDNYSVHLLRNIKTGQYDLQSINPKLKTFKELQKELQDSHNVPGVLCSIRQAFLKIKEKKNLLINKTQS